MFLQFNTQASSDIVQQHGFAHGACNELNGPGYNIASSRHVLQLDKLDGRRPWCQSMVRTLLLMGCAITPGPVMPPPNSSNHAVHRINTLSAIVVSRQGRHSLMKSQSIRQENGEHIGFTPTPLLVI